MCLFSQSDYYIKDHFNKIRYQFSVLFPLLTIWNRCINCLHLTNRLTSLKFEREQIRTDRQTKVDQWASGLCLWVREHLFMSVLITVMSTLTSTRPSSDQCMTNTHTQPSTHTHLHERQRGNRTGCTFQAADPPEAWVGERPGVFLVLVVGVLLGRVGRAVADEGSGVQPVVGADGHCHQGEGRKRSHGGQQHLDATLTPHQRRARKETDIWQEHRNQEHFKLLTRILSISIVLFSSRDNNNYIWCWRKCPNMTVILPELKLRLKAQDD